MLGEHIGDHGSAVVVTLHRVCPQHLGRPTAGAGVHSFVDEPTHFLKLFLGGPAGLSLVPAHDPGVQRSQGHVGEAVHTFGGVGQRVDEVWERNPVPGHALFHRVVGDGLVASHAQHGPVLVLDAGGGETEPAIAQGNGRHAVPPGQCAVGVPEYLGVVVGVKVNETRGHDQALGVQFTVRGAAVKTADLDDSPVFDGDVAHVTGCTGAVDDGPASDDDVVVRHAFPPISVFRLRDGAMCGNSRVLGMLMSIIA